VGLLVESEVGEDHEDRGRKDFQFSSQSLSKFTVLMGFTWTISLIKGECLRPWSSRHLRSLPLKDQHVLLLSLLADALGWSRGMSAIITNCQVFTAALRWLPMLCDVQAVLVQGLRLILLLA
jgi:hypothetical protein